MQLPSVEFEPLPVEEIERLADAWDSVALSAPRLLADLKRYRQSTLTLLKFLKEGQEIDPTSQSQDFCWPPHVVAEVRRICELVGIEPFDPKH